MSAHRRSKQDLSHSSHHSARSEGIAANSRLRIILALVLTLSSWRTAQSVWEGSQEVLSFTTHAQSSQASTPTALGIASGIVPVDMENTSTQQWRDRISAMIKDGTFFDSLFPTYLEEDEDE